MIYLGEAFTISNKKQRGIFSPFVFVLIFSYQVKIADVWNLFAVPSL